MLHVDIETRSRVDIGNGLDLYVHCPDIEILVVAWAFGDGPVQTWDIHDGDRPAELIAALRDPSVKKLAWNARFEQALFARCWDVHVPDEAWIDPMVVVLTLGLPGSLKDAGVALGLPAESLKNTDGSRLIRKFCVPREPTAKKPHEWSTRETDPTDWVRFRHYCEQDVIAERSIWHIVAPYDLDPGEWALWALDHRINARGLAIDLDLVRGAIALDEREKARSLADLNTLTGLPNGGSVTQLLPWLRDRGYRHGGLDKATVARALSEPDLADTVREALRLRSEISRTSVAKYASIMNWCGPDGRLRNVLQFAGAGRTGRWAGRGPQFQNLPRPARTVSSEEDMAFAAQCVRERDAATLEAVYGSVPDVLSSLVRAAIVASAGKKLVVCDFSSIEVAVIAWLTGSEPLLDVFRRGQDPYKVFAAGFYRKPYDQVTKAERSFSKPAVLGCGFRLGPGEAKPDGTKVGLLGYADAMGVSMNEEQAKAAVKFYRDTYPEVPQAWYALESAMKQAVRERTDVIALDGRVAFSSDGDCLQMRLPSGRWLKYWQPLIETVETPWGERRPTLTYLGKQQMGGKVGRIATHGGKALEQATQATARDVLAEGLRRAEAAGYHVVLHAHDEIVAEVDTDHPELGVDHLAGVLCAPIPWAETMPLGAAGFEGAFYRKD